MANMDLLSYERDSRWMPHLSWTYPEWTSQERIEQQAAQRELAWQKISDKLGPLLIGAELGSSLGQSDYISLDLGEADQHLERAYEKAPLLSGRVVPARRLGASQATSYSTNNRNSKFNTCNQQDQHQMNGADHHQHNNNNNYQRQLKDNNRNENGGPHHNYDTLDSAKPQSPGATSSSSSGLGSVSPNSRRQQQQQQSKIQQQLRSKAYYQAQQNYYHQNQRELQQEHRRGFNWRLAVTLIILFVCLCLLVCAVCVHGKSVLFPRNFYNPFVGTAH